jgi:hexokinase
MRGRIFVGAEIGECHVMRAASRRLRIYSPSFPNSFTVPSTPQQTNALVQVSAAVQRAPNSIATAIETAAQTVMIGAGLTAPAVRMIIYGCHGSWKHLKRQR